MKKKVPGMIATFYRFLLVCLSSYFLLSCSSQSKKYPEDNRYIVKIDVGNLHYTNDFQSAICSVDTLLLEENDSLFVGVVDKIVQTDHNLFVLDRKKARAVFMYRKDGTFIRTIGGEGAGVGEFLSPDGLCVDEDNGEIILLDKNGRTFLFYDFEGNFIRSLKYDGFINDFCVYDRDKLLLDGGNIPDGSSHCLTVIDRKTGNIINRMLPKDTLLQNFPFMSLYPLMRMDGRLIYQPSMSTEIYEIQTDSLYCRYEFDFGTHWPKRKDFERINEQDPNMLFKEFKKQYVLFPSLLETSRTVFACFSYKENLIAFFEDKITKKREAFIIDLNSDFSLPIEVIGDKFVSVKYRENSSPMILFYTVNL